MAMLGDVRRLLAVAWRAASGRRALAATISLMAGLSATVGLVFPLAGQTLIDAVILAGGATGGARAEAAATLIGIAVAVVAAAAVQIATSTGISLVTEVFSTGFRAALQADLLEKILRLPLRRFETTQFAALVIRDVTAVETIFVATAPALVAGAVQLTAGVAILVAWDAAVAGAAVGAGVFYVMLSTVGNRELRARGRNVADLAGQMMVKVVARIHAVTLVKLAVAEERETAAFRAEAEALRAEQVALVRRSLWLSVRDQIAMRGLTLGLAGLVVMRTVEGHLTAGQLVGTLAYLGMISGPFGRLAGQIRAAQHTLAAYDRLHDVWDAEPESAPGAASESALGAGRQPYPEGPLTVSAEQISFAYAPQKPVLAGASVRVSPGEIVGLAGPTGCGKSTLALILCGLMEPDAGVVRVNGVPLPKVPRTAHRTAVGLVLQREVIYGASVREVLNFQAPTATDAEMTAMVEALGGGEWFRDLPGGLDARVLETGKNFSGGQRQILALARALLARPRLLILDEATAGLDEPREDRVLAAVKAAILPGGSVLLISHRTTALSHADRVVNLAPCAEPNAE